LRSRLRRGLLSYGPWRASTCLLLVSFFAFFQTGGATTNSSDTARDSVLFVNGDRLTGQFVVATETSVEFAGKVTGTVSLSWTDIKELRLSGADLAIVSKTGKDGKVPKNFTVSEPAVENNGTDLVFERQNEESMRVPLAQLVSATPTKQPHWRGSLQSQDSIVGATQKQYQLGGTLHVSRATQDTHKLKHQVTDINLLANYGESKNPGVSPVRTVLYDGLFQHNVFLKDNPNNIYGGAYVFALTDFYHNLSLGMNVEQTYGGGIGWDGRYGNNIFGFAGDIRYVNENIYSPGKSLNLAATGLSEHYALTLPWPKKNPITIFERISFIPALSESHAFQARGIAGLDLPLTDRFSVGVQEMDDYLQNAPAKSNQNYSTTQFTIRYTIGSLPPKSPRQSLQ
jgi:hypothetical protein